MGSGINLGGSKISPFCLLGAHTWLRNTERLSDLAVIGSYANMVTANRSALCEKFVADLGSTVMLTCNSSILSHLKSLQSYSIHIVMLLGKALFNLTL